MQPLARSWAANGAKRVSAPEPPAPLRSTVPRKLAALALFSEQLPASFAYILRADLAFSSACGEKKKGGLGRLGPSHRASGQPPPLLAQVRLARRLQLPCMRLACLTPRPARLGCVPRSVRPFTDVPSSASFAHESTCSQSWVVAASRLPRHLSQLDCPSGRGDCSQPDLPAASQASFLRLQRLVPQHLRS